jgi:flagellar hook-associated protein 2
MSTSSVSSSTGSSSTTGFQLSSLAGSASLQITGLASGLNTNQIISAEMAIYQQPVTNLQNQQSGLKALNTQLSSIQSELQTLSANALALGAPTLFKTTQSVTSSDPTRVSASSGNGAGVGGYQVAVSQLANSAQRTFSFSSPASDDPISIDGHQYTINAGESIQDFVASINSDTTGTVYASATNSGSVIFSNRATGNTGANFIQVQDSGGVLTEQTALARQGKDAQYTIDGISGTSSSNTIANAIGGVSLTLSGVTTTSGPVTINVGAPAPSSTNIESAVNTFMKQYNQVISDIQTQLAQAPSSSDPTQGTLSGDSQLRDLLASMRTAMFSPGQGLSQGMATMDDIGVSTGATTGSGAVSSSALNGNLQFNAQTLEAALQSNPSGVKSVLGTWSAKFVGLVDNAAVPGGTIATRIQGDGRHITDLGNQISTMQSALADKQSQLVKQFADLEAALSQNQSTSSWLTSQLAALPGP